jgi:surfeit locus 1 family protein
MLRSLKLMPRLFGRQWLISTLVVLAGMAVLARLGIWQLDRLEQRRARNVELRQALEATPLDLAAYQMPASTDELKNRDVVVRGKFDYSQQVYLKLQSWNGRPGGHLVTPLVIEGGETAVLVDRGWIPDSDAAVENWSKYKESSIATINGYIGLTQTLDAPEAGGNQPAMPQLEWYRIDVEAIAAQMSYPLLPFYVVQRPLPNGNTEPPFRSEREIDLSEGPHLGYAIQWFIFALMLGGAYMVYVNKSLKPT